jgi:exopolysaccharide production protein ExoY
MQYTAISIRFLHWNQQHFVIGGAVKRILDFSISTLMLVVLLPLIIILAVVVKSADAGPVIFRQTRIGLEGRRFQRLKFRSMVANADEGLTSLLNSNPELSQEWDRKQKLAKDPRITPIGSFLRRSGLDELPQLINVIRGEMSTTGRGPTKPSEAKRYGDKLGLYLRARPGITGIWQVSGRSSCGYDERVAMDADYISNWRFSRDLAILLRTPAAVFARRGSS